MSKVQVAHMEVMRKILTLVGKCEGKRLLGRSRHREGIMLIHLKETMCIGLSGIG
jgi:hypothetical protein